MVLLSFSSLTVTYSSRSSPSAGRTKKARNKSTGGGRTNERTRFPWVRLQRNDCHGAPLSKMLLEPRRHTITTFFFPFLFFHSSDLSVQRCPLRLDKEDSQIVKRDGMAERKIVGSGGETERLRECAEVWMEFEWVRGIWKCKVYRRHSCKLQTEKNSNERTIKHHSWKLLGYAANVPCLQADRVVRDNSPRIRLTRMNFN